RERAPQAEERADHSDVLDLAHALEVVGGLAGDETIEGGQGDGGDDGLARDGLAFEANALDRPLPYVDPRDADTCSHRHTRLRLQPVQRGAHHRVRAVGEVAEHAAAEAALS